MTRNKRKLPLPRANHDWRRDARRANPRLSLYGAPRRNKTTGDYARPINRLVTEPARSTAIDWFLTGNGPWEDKE